MSDPALDRAALADDWARAVGVTVYVPLSPAELRALLLGMVDQLVAALTAEPFDPVPVAEVGTRLVRSGLTGVDTLQATVTVLSEHLRPAGSQRQLIALLGTLATAYAQAIRVSTLDQQEQVKQALFAATKRSEAELRASERRFREVFQSSAIGIAITELDGEFRQTNPALAEIIGRRREPFAGRVLADLFTDETRSEIVDAVDRASTGVDDRIRTKAELVGDGGDTVWATVAISLLRDDSGAPESLVTLVHDNTELTLLQREYQRIASTDPLTGFHNRPYFQSRVETVLGRSAPGVPVTMLHIDIDNFTMVNQGYGYQVGNEVLTSVAEKLKRVFADERAEFGRIDGDAFAVLVENGPHTPPTEELIQLVQRELAEPDYLDGEHSIAVGASIGAVGRLLSTDPVEFFQVTDSALGKAKRSGLRQWADYDQPEAAAERDRSRLASGLAGGVENGEVVLGYRPVTRLADGRGVGVLAGISWRRPGRAPVPDAECTRLAELSGLSVQLGPWLLRDACGHLPVWQTLAGPSGATAAVLRVRLTAAQSADGDLVAAVNAAVTASGVAPDLLEIAFDTGAIASGFGTAADNLEVVAANGVRVALHSFTGGPAQLDLLESAKTRSVVLADPFGAQRPHRRPERSAMVSGTVDLLAALHRIGAEVCVDQVSDRDEAAWWLAHGAHTATGPRFGQQGDVHDMMAVFGRGV